MEHRFRSVLGLETVCSEWFIDHTSDHACNSARFRCETVLLDIDRAINSEFLPNTELFDSHPRRKKKVLSRTFVMTNLGF